MVLLGLEPCSRLDPTGPVSDSVHLGGRGGGRGRGGESTFLTSSQVMMMSPECHTLRTRIQVIEKYLFVGKPCFIFMYLHQ